MESKIQSLKETTFGGKRYTRNQLEQITKTVNSFPDLSRRELAHTICEHISLTTPTGKHRIHACLEALAAMEKAGLFTLPSLQEKAKPKQKKISWTENTNKQEPVCSSLNALLPITIKKATEKNEIALWNEYVDRYHYLGYKRPIGTHLRYFITSGSGTREKILGCLLFSFATKALKCRDDWIGWSSKDNKKYLHLIINNNRFLIFPWVNVKNLASKALSLVCKQVSTDWEETHGFRPLLLETFVDPEKYSGTCYSASNWQHIGQTAGTTSVSKKDVYMYPLHTNFKSILKSEKKPPSLKSKQSRCLLKRNAIQANDPFISLWENVIDIIKDTTTQFDKQWQKRQRCIGSMLLVLFIFRLVFSKNTQGYQTTINELWDMCKTMKLPLPNSKPPVASAFCNARKKMDENIFKTINSEIIEAYENSYNAEEYKFKGHRLFATDGSKMNLPKKLKASGYPMPTITSHYPQGLVSCLYQVKSKIPYDFDLVSHENERTVALKHLTVLSENDIVVYDRGYFSYEMLYRHVELSIHPVFRIKKKTHKAIDKFRLSNSFDEVVTIEAPRPAKKKMLEENPHVNLKPLKIRLIKYTMKGTVYVLGTTLFDTAKYKLKDFPNLYHSRWGVEELFKVSKKLLEVIDFHGKSERGVKQELYANFAIITLNRFFSNKVDQDINSNNLYSKHNDYNKNSSEKEKANFKVNIKNSLITIARFLESLFLQKANLLVKTINNTFNSILNCIQKERPGRSYVRKSMQPIGKWQKNRA